MSKITRKASRSSRGGRRSGRKSGAADSSAPGATQQGASSHSHRAEAVAGDAPPQTSVASLSLEQLMDVVGPYTGFIQCSRPLHVHSRWG